MTLRLTLYEIKKLTGLKYLWILLAIMLILCSLLFYATINYYDDIDKYRAERDVLKQFFDDYNKNPEPYDAALEHYTAYNNYKSALDMLKRGANVDESQLEYVPEYVDSLGYKYPNGKAVPDSFLLENLRSRKTENTSRYPEFINNVLSRAENKMRLYEIQGAKEAPVYEYQQMLYKQYKKLADNISLPVKYTYGWGTFFTFDRISIFIFAYIILSAGIVFINEKTCGFLPVLRSSKHGVVKTAVAKIISLFLFSIFVVIAFTVVTFLTCYFLYGFSDPNDLIQQIGYYWQCPYALTMWQYALLTLAMRCVAAATLACALAAISALTYSHAITYIAGVCVLGWSLISYYFLTSSGWLHVNMMNVASSDDILATYNVIVFFKKCFNIIPFILVLYGIIFAAFFIGTLITSRYHRGTLSTSEIGLNKIKAFVQRITKHSDFAKTTLSSNNTIAHATKKSKRIRTPLCSSLIIWETHKLLSLNIIIIVLLLLGASFYNHYNIYNRIISQTERAYTEFVNSIFGELTEEKRQYIYEEKLRCDSIEEYYYNVSDKYLSGEISQQEYYRALDDYLTISQTASMLDIANEKLIYLNSLEKETGVRGWFFAEDRISRMLTTDFDVFFVLAVIIIFTRTYVVEYQGKSSEGHTASIIRTMKRGRLSVYRAKLLATVIITAILCVLFFSFDFILGAVKVERFDEILKAPIMSLESFRSINSDITIGEFFALTYALRTFGFILLAIICSGISYLTKNLTLSVFIISIMVFVPYALVYMGVAILHRIDYTALLSGIKLLLRSSQMNPTSPMTFAVIFPATAFIIALGFIIAQRRFAK